MTGYNKRFQQGYTLTKNLVLRKCKNRVNLNLFISKIAKSLKQKVTEQ